jgi:hypothetical protein
MSTVRWWFLSLLIVSLCPAAVWAQTPGSGPAAAPPVAPVTNTGKIASWTPDPEITARIAADPTAIQKQLDLAMRKVLLNPKSLTIQFQEKSPADTALGRFEKIWVKTDSGSVDNLVLNKADLEFLDVHLDTTKLFREEKIDTVSVGQINMDVIIKESDMNLFLANKAAKINVDNPKVTMRPGKIEVSGSTKYSFMKVSFWATGVFSVKDAKAIWFHSHKLRINGIGMPRAFVGNLIKRINPVLNLEKFPFKLNLKDIRIEPGALHFTSSQ